MDLKHKLEILADAAKYDVSCASSGSNRANAGGLGDARSCGICHSYTPDGRCVSLLKVLLTNYCIYDCRFCINRVSSDVARARFTTDEVIYLTLAFYRRNFIEGLFLSSGIIRDPDYTMEQMVEIVRRLRDEQRFFGYVHLKAIPGAAPELLEQAGRYADRLSANIELPTDADLRLLAPDKPLRTVLDTMSTIRDRHQEAAQESRRGTRRPHSSRAPRGRNRRFAPAGQSTQMVIGATAAPDLQILTTASDLYRRQRLKRVYYSGFTPIPHPDSHLPVRPPPLVREHRLYQADWLMRFYGFQASELVRPELPNLELEQDPKLSWALRNRDFFPLDVNTAPREALLRVPGLGVRNVTRIVQARRHRKLRMADLQRLRVPLKRARPFIVTADDCNGPRILDSSRLTSAVAQPRQLELFDASVTARTGEL